jgi:predicted acetyltransferase
MESGHLTFRTPTADDIPTLAELSYHSFPFAELPIDARERKYRESPLARMDNLLVGEVDGKIVASLNGIPFTTWVGGAPQPMLGLAGVVVAHEARRHGYASKLVVEALSRARSRGVALSALYPFRHDFYASLGYAQAVERRLWEFNPADLPVYPERIRARRGGDVEFPAVTECYRRVLARSTLMVERSEAEWRIRALAEGKRFTVVYEDEGGMVRGYFVYGYEEFPDERLTRLFIGELVYEDQSALRGLLGYIAALRDQFVEVACVTAADERLELRLRNPRERGAIKGSILKLYGPTVLWGAMARVLDVEKALRARPSYNGATGNVWLAVSDEQLPDNTRPLEVAFDEGRISVTASNEVGTSQPAARMSIGTFAQLYLGFASASETRRVGSIEADDEAVMLLDRAFAGPRPFLLDSF